MARTIRVQSDSNAHVRPWRVAVEQGFFAEEGLDVVYHEDNPKGTEGRVKDFAHRWKETQLQQGALEVYPVCEWGAITLIACFMSPLGSSRGDAPQASRWQVVSL